MDQEYAAMEAVWKRFPEATLWGSDNTFYEIYESDKPDAKVLGKGKTSLEAWQSVLKQARVAEWQTR